MRAFSVWALVVVLSQVGCGRDRIQEGWRLFREGDVEGARAAFAEAAKRHRAAAELARGELEYALSNYEEAAQHFAESVSANGKEPLAYAWYGAARWKWRPDEAALQAFLRALELASEGEHLPLIAGTLADAYETKRLTTGEVDHHSPCFTPDGKGLVLTRQHNGSGELFLLDLETNGMTPLVEMPTTNEYGTRFSPDGKSLLFASEQRRSEAAVLNIQSSGSTPRSEMFYLLDWATKATTPLLSSPSSVGNPVFTPDGKRILFESVVDGNLDVWEMNLDGSNRRRLTTGKEDDGKPVPTPDGKRILFVQGREGNFDLMTMKPDGTDPKPLLRTPANEFGGIFSPDGRQVYVTRSEGLGYQLVVLDGTTHRIRPLSGGLGDSLQPALSPDGKRLVFVNNRSDYLQLYEMDLTKPVRSEALKRQIQTRLNVQNHLGGSP